MGEKLVRNFSEIGVLKYVCDSDTDRAKEMGKMYSIEDKSFQDILKTDVDGVIIAAPAKQHHKLARSSLKAGKHVFVEKPISLSVIEAENLCVIAKQQNKILMVGHLLQYHSAFFKLKEIVKKVNLVNYNIFILIVLTLGNFAMKKIFCGVLLLMTFL